jgi:hypothetical protein
MDANIKCRRIRESENHDIQYIGIYKGLKIVRRADHFITNHITH